MKNAKFVTYAHREAPHSYRYRAGMDDAIPPWAVDVRIHSEFGDRLINLLSGVSYKQNWAIRVDNSEDRWFLQWLFEGPCAVTGKVEKHSCRKWWLSEHMTDGEIVQTAFLAAMAAEEHECREFFKYKNHRVFGPHIRLEALMSVCDDIEVRQLEGK